MRFFGISMSGASILLALVLAIWEGYFFWLSGHGIMGALDGSVGLFTPDRLGLNLAWLVTFYLSFQLLSIPFAVSPQRLHLVTVFDAMASVVPLSIVLIVMLGRPTLIGTSGRWEVALILMAVNSVELFGGYALSLALNRRTVDMIAVQTLTPKASVAATQ